MVYMAIFSPVLFTIYFASKSFEELAELRDSCEGHPSKDQMKAHYRQRRGDTYDSICQTILDRYSELCCMFKTLPSARDLPSIFSDTVAHTRD
jgi:hypothetical protein